MARRHHRHHRRHHRRHHGLRLNPSGALAAVVAGPKEMVSGEFIKEAVSVAAGFLLPGMVLPRIPAQFRNATWKAYGSKVAVVAGLSAVAGMAVSKRAAKLVLLGGGVSILLDLYADFVQPAISGVMAPPAPAPASGAAAYFGNSGDPGVAGLADFDSTPQLESFFGNPNDPGVAGLAAAFS